MRAPAASRAGPQQESDACCGALLLLLWALLTAGGVLLPEQPEWAVYSALRGICRKPIIGALCTVTAMPVYAAARLLGEAADASAAASASAWGTSPGRAVLTLGGSCLPNLEEREDQAYASLRQCAGATPVLGGPLVAVVLPMYAAVQLLIAIVRAVVWTVSRYGVIQLARCC